MPLSRIPSTPSVRYTEVAGPGWQCAVTVGDDASTAGVHWCVAASRCHVEIDRGGLLALAKMLVAAAAALPAECA